MRLSTYDKPRVIACAEDHPHHIGLPRGCLDDVRQALTDLGVRTAIRDERYAGRPLDVSFQGELRPEQKAAADAMLAHETGVLAATTAFGKTVVAAWLIAQRGVNTLVLVHRRQLLDQWIERLSTFLGMPAKSIGRIGGGRSRPTGLLDVAIIQSLVRKGVVDDRVADYGHVIVDECHHLSAHSFEQVARQAKARFVMGLSATVARKDGHHPDHLHAVRTGSPSRERAGRRRRPARSSTIVLVQPTAFQPSRSPDADKRVEFQALYQELIDDELRNSSHLRRRHRVGAATAGRRWCSRSGTITSTASSRGLRQRVRHLVVLRAGMGKKQRQAVADRLAAIPREEARVILATGKYVGEGFDDPRLDTLFLTLPVSWRGTIAQYAGRLHRLYDGKREVRIYDYADLNVPMLARMFDRRCRGYEAVGYTILLPASAIPGWPADVVLPSDPVWKRDYSGSVRQARPGRRRYAAREPVRPRRSDGASRRRRRRPSAQCDRSVSLPAAGDAAGDQGPFPRQRRAADRVRRLREDWKSICCVPMRAWRWSWTAPSISRIRSRTAATGARTSCCRRTAIWCCASLRKTWARNWTWCSTRSCER